jgi:hypothetical protein
MRLISQASVLQFFNVFIFVDDFLAALMRRSLRFELTWIDGFAFSVNGQDSRLACIDVAK